MCIFTSRRHGSIDLRLVVLLWRLGGAGFEDHVAVLIESLDHALMNDIARRFIRFPSTLVILVNCLVLEGSNVCQWIIDTRLNVPLQFLIVNFGALCKQILGPCVDAIAMEVMRLEEFRPKFRLGHLLRHVLLMLSLNCGVCLEYTLDNVHC